MSYDSTYLINMAKKSSTFVFNGDKIIKYLITLLDFLDRQLTERTDRKNS